MQEVISLNKLIVSGGYPLQGEVKISGAKNAALAVLAASLVSTGESIIHNVPRILDVFYLCEILKSLGAEVEFVNTNSIRVKIDSLASNKTEYGLAKKLRASNLVLGPLLARTGEVEIPLPGGCQIGSRPMDLHIKGMKMLGADIKLEHGYIVGRARKLVGASIYLDFPSVGATENIMLAASLAEGVTVLENCAKEPEIVDLANYLNFMGARIKGAGTSTIKIEGVESLYGREYTIIPDRIEAGTYIGAAAVTLGKVLIEDVILTHIDSLIAKFREAGIAFKEYEDKILVDATQVTRPKAIDVKTLPYPGLPTDIQPVLGVFLTRADGTSVVTETVFGNRFMYIDELKRMGAQMMRDGHSVIIVGVDHLDGTLLSCTDLRGGAAMVIGALCAQGDSEIQKIDHVLRGYEGLDQKLQNLGAKIWYVENGK
jgi:UDP-N-acetylglucosamine 1-carboxyvinyltransferase